MTLTANRTAGPKLRTPPQPVYSHTRQIHPLQGMELTWVRSILKMAKSSAIDEIALGAAGALRRTKELTDAERRFAVEVLRFSIMRGLSDYDQARMDQALAGALSGDVKMAEQAPIEDPSAAAMITQYLHLAGAPAAALRACIASAWCDGRGEEGGAYLLEQCSWDEREYLFSIFRSATFQPPPELGDPFTIWRGAKNQTIDQAMTGLSWTTDRDVACFFARRSALRGDPIVLRATVRRSDVLIATNLRNENEIVPVAISQVSIDDTPDTWAEAAQRAIDAIAERNRLRLSPVTAL